MRGLLHLALAGLALAVAFACGGSSGGDLANKNGISGTGALAKAVDVQDVDLAHASYGRKAAEGTYVVNTLSPVFRIVLAEASDPAEVERLLDVAFTRLDTGETARLGDLRSRILLRPAGDGRTFFLVLVKSAAVAIGNGELSPGCSYGFAIQPREGTRLLSKGTDVADIRGQVLTRTVTFTYPCGEGTDSQVDLQLADLAGLGSLTPAFLVHSARPLEGFDPARAAEGYGMLDRLRITVNGQDLRRQKLDSLRVEDASPSAFRLGVLPGTGLAWQASYRLGFQPEGLSVKVGPDSVQLKDDDLPQGVEIQTRRY